MGAAAGLAHEGAQPFVTTYAVFATRRAYDFMHQAIAEDNLDVKIVCALPGLTTGYGPSHQAAEDLALMRAMPNMTVIDPCDALDIEQMVAAIPHTTGLCMRVFCAATCLRCWMNTATSSNSARQNAARRRGSARHLVGHHDHARAGSRESAGSATTSAWACCTCRPSSRSTRRRSCAKRSVRAGSSWWRKTIRRSAVSVRPLRRTDRAGCRAMFGRWRSPMIPCSGRTADTARPLWYFNRRDGRVDQGLARLSQTGGAFDGTAFSL